LQNKLPKKKKNFRQERLFAKMGLRGAEFWNSGSIFDLMALAATVPVKKCLKKI
jgi:hypothetical protein